MTVLDPIFKFGELWAILDFLEIDSARMVYMSSRPMQTCTNFAKEFEHQL